MRQAKISARLSCLRRKFVLAFARLSSPKPSPSAAHSIPVNVSVRASLRNSGLLLPQPPPLHTTRSPRCCSPSKAMCRARFSTLTRLRQTAKFAHSIRWSRQAPISPKAQGPRHHCGITSPLINCRRCINSSAIKKSLFAISMPWPKRMGSTSNPIKAGL